MTQANPTNPKNPDKKEAKTHVVNFKRRKILTDEFLNSDFYKEYFLPACEHEIQANDKLSKVSESDDPQRVFNDFWKQKNKVSVYRGILNKLKEWSQKTNNPGGN